MTLPHPSIPEILTQYGFSIDDFTVKPVGSGYIHLTFALEGSKKWILQRVNKNVFKQPEIIAENIRLAGDYLQQHYPDFLFLKALQTKTGKVMAYDHEQFPWRIFPFFEDTYTVDHVRSGEEAFSAAAEFGRLSKNLEGAPVEKFRETINRFHDLELRYQQFEMAIRNASADRLLKAASAVESCKKFHFLVDHYNKLVSSGALRLRITHNDTKINNILFDNKTGKAVCAIDLDTLMPGYFIYDLGDMVRTFVSPVDEEESDLSKIVFRKEIYDAIIAGYLSTMNETLTASEKEAISFSGLMMTYIMGLRILSDYLNGDIYYTVRYEGQNLIRARNQLKLLDVLNQSVGFIPHWQ
jgi:Ser/Thr protein kinase RdoA (MazF antagonist)